MSAKSDAIIEINVGLQAKTKSEIDEYLEKSREIKENLSEARTEEKDTSSEKTTENKKKVDSAADQAIQDMQNQINEIKGLQKPQQAIEKGVGKLFGDKGYISQKLFDLLFDDGIQLVTKIRKNMINRLMPMFDKVMLRKRAIIETIHDQLKNISQIEHTRHRSVVNFMVNVISALIAYSHREKKPSLNIRGNDFAELPAIII